MTNFQKFIGHLKTIHKHRKFVCSWCFKMGIPIQGVLHDLSKYSPKEFSIYKYYTGTASPHETAREDLGYSPSWVFHKAHNKHHWEYWLDNNGNSIFVPVKMPYKYVIECFCDFIGAGKAYLGESWATDDPLKYFEKTAGSRLYHEDTNALLYFLFLKLHEYGEDLFPRVYKIMYKKDLAFVYNLGGEFLKRYLGFGGNII